MNDGRRYSIWSPILSNLPPTRPTLTPPFTLPVDAGISLEQALAGYTINGAAQLGLEGEVGVIKAGLLADFIVLPQNPFETDVEKIHAIEPSATVVAGELRSGSF